MKASEMIGRVDRKHDNSIELIDKLSYINSIEKNVYSQIVLEPYEEKIDIVANQDLYTLDGYIFEDIVQLKVNGTEYTLGSAMIQADNTYFKKNGQLCIKPMPNMDKAAGLVIIRRWKPDAIKEADYQTRELLLPDEFLEAYEFYLRSQISLEQKDAAEASAYGSIYNGVMEEFTQWYMQKQPNLGKYKADLRWKK